MKTRPQLIMLIGLLLLTSIASAGTIGMGTVSTNSVTCWPYVFDQRHIETNEDVVRIQVPNDQNCVLINLEQTIGLYPQGPYPTLTARLDATTISSTSYASIWSAVYSLGQATATETTARIAQDQLIGQATGYEQANRINQDILIGQATGQEQASRMAQDILIGQATGYERAERISADILTGQATGYERIERINTDILTGQATGYERIERQQQDLVIGQSTATAKTDVESFKLAVSTTYATIGQMNGKVSKAGDLMTGDLEFTDIEEGIIIKSANGSRFKIKVDNNGVLFVESQ